MFYIAVSKMTFITTTTTAAATTLQTQYYYNVKVTFFVLGMSWKGACE